MCCNFLLHSNTSIEEVKPSLTINTPIFLLSNNDYFDLPDILPSIYPLKKASSNLYHGYFFQSQKNISTKKPQQNWSLIIAGIITLGSTIISILLLFFIKTIRKRNRSLAAKNIEIAQFNEKLDSKVTQRTADLEEKTETLNNYFDNLPGVSYRFLVNADFTPVFISKSCINLFGLSPAFILHSQTLRTLIPENRYHDIIVKINTFIKENNHEEILELKHQITTKENRIKWVMNRSKLYIHSNGKKYLDGIFLDITDQVVTEYALKSSQKELSLIYNNTQDFMGLIKIDKDENLTIESVNKPYLDYLTKRKFIRKGQSLTGLNIKEYLRGILQMPHEGLKERIEVLNAVRFSQKVVNYETKIPIVGNQQDIFNITLTPIIEQEETVASRIIFVLNDITVQKKASEKVVDSEKQLSMVFNGSKDMFLIFDVHPNGSVVFTSANEAFITQIKQLKIKEGIEKLYGQEIRYFYNNFTSHSKEEVEERVQIANKAIRTKKPIEYPGFFIDKNNNKYLSEITVTPIFNKQGICEKLFYISRDVTQKVTAQQALTTSEKRLSTIYNASQDVIGLIRLNNTGGYEIESINQPTIEILKKVNMNVSKDYFVGMTMNNLFEEIFNLPKSVIAERMNMMEQVFTKNKTFKYKSPFQPKGSGAILDFETVVSPILNIDGKCTHALYTARDITESESAKSKLLLSEKRQDSIFNGANDQMAILDVMQNGEILFEDSNLSFQKSWEATKVPTKLESVYGKNIKYCLTDVIHFSEKEAKQRIALCKQIIRDKKPVNYEETFIGFDNKKYILDVTISAILDKDDHCKKLLFILRDVTLKQKARERMISKILETEDRERSRFAKELHDSLGQNLTVASLNFNFVKKNISELNKDTQEKFEAGYNFLKEAIQESRNIAHNLMPQAISDFGYVLAIESLIDSIAQTTEIKFRFYDNLKGSRLALDHELSLYRITQEAINNILKHADANEVSIQLIKHEKSIILTIEDNGKGFAIQSQKTNSFGLNSMRNRASALSGVIDIDSAPKKGTSITLEIPV